ncbi:MAG: response regulator transcription factor [Magnetovibrio sp.]|nr:response regulator transcription factor [Magnetovibrio sp.]
MNFTRILIVDDSPTVCEFLSRGLTDKKYQTLQATRMEDALKHGGQLVDLIITDIIMPGMDGYEGIRRIKRNWPDVPVIAMSAGAGEGGRDKTLLKARNIGADAILQKPFSIDVLTEKIEYLLARRGGESKTRVLIVEDSTVQRKVMRRMFEDGRHEVFEAETAEQALASREIVGVDLLVTDIFMPGEGGLSVIQKIRKNWPNIRIVAVSGGWKDDKQGEQGLSAAEIVGADAGLKKPFSPDELFAVVDKVLAREGHALDTDGTALPA